MPPERQAVRAIVVNRFDRVLLFHADLPDHVPIWYTPGGAVEPGESDAAALARELEEETRLVVDPATLGPPVWTRDYIFRWHNVDERHLERFFLIRIEEHEVDTSGLDPEELEMSREFRWWALDEMVASIEHFSPVRLPELVAPLLEGRIPAEPIATGD
ncbi:MAG: NUDIX domain-containing protein [Candidatus Dormiibacterota bacterium]